MSVKILIADDHPIVRQGLRNLLENEPDIQVIGEAGNGIEAVEAVTALKPDILIVDIMMPGLNGLEVVRQAKLRFPALLIIVLSMHSNEAYVVEALRKGADGYVLKDTAPAELTQVVKEVRSGHRYLSPALSERLVDAYIQKSEISEVDPLELLTTREREVMQLAAQGLTSAEIATQLSVSRRTVEQHRSNLMDKLGLRNQTDLVRFAIKRKLLLIDD